MNNKYCRRCLTSFKSDGRMIIHLLKKDKCIINNPDYDAEYEKQLIILLEQANYDIESDLKKYIIESNDKITYQCNLCQRELTHLCDISRHLIESCLNSKYTIRGPLLDHINQSKNAKDQKKFKIKLKEIFEIDPIIDKLPKKSLQEMSNLYSEYIIEISENKYQCTICNGIFMDKEAILYHLDEKCIMNMIDNINKLPRSILESQFSLMKTETTNNNVSKILKSHDVIDNNSIFSHLFNELKQEIKQTKQELHTNIKQTEDRLSDTIENIKNKPSITNNTINENLQILCLDSNKNCMDVLVEKYGDFHQALEFVKGCALSQMTGDVRLIEEVYLNSDEHPAFWYMDKKRHKMGWIDEKNQKNIDVGGKIILRKLVNNLQNGYLKGVNYLINKNLDEKRCPNKFLAEYDIQAWNRHIYNLCDEKYQKKLFDHLDIPTKPHADI